MVALPSPAAFDEARRLAALHAANLLGSAPEKEFAALTALAAQLLDVPSAMVTLLDADRQWVKSGHNAPFRETPRGDSICHHTVADDALLVVPDAAADPRFADGPLVRDGLRFYAGLPLHAPDPTGAAQPIGALCVIDQRPRSLTAEGERALRHLAALAEALVAARTTAGEATRLAEGYADQARRLRRHERRLRHAERMAMIGAWQLDAETGAMEWSEMIYRLYGLPPGSPPPVERALDHFTGASRARLGDALAALLARGDPYDLELDFRAADGTARRVRAIGEPERTGGRVTGAIGVFQDVTERHRMEALLRHTADHDALTGLANRAAFDRALAEALACAGEAPFRLVLIDLDGFKAVNDTLGHLAGDEVLRAVAARLRAPWLAGAAPARIGGDEFALIVREPELRCDPVLAERLEAALRVEAGEGALRLPVGGAIGAADAGEANTPRELLRLADARLYAAKRARAGERRRGERRRPQA